MSHFRFSAVSVVTVVLLVGLAAPASSVPQPVAPRPAAPHGLVREHLSQTVTSTERGEVLVSVATKPKLPEALVTAYTVKHGHRRAIGTLITGLIGVQNGGFAEKPGKRVRIQVGVGATKTTRAALSKVVSLKVHR